MAENNTGRCPKCSEEMTNDIECLKCGIVFTKYFQAEERKRNEAGEIPVIVPDRRNNHSSLLVIFFVSIIAIALYYGTKLNSSSGSTSANSQSGRDRSYESNHTTLNMMPGPTETVNHHGDEHKDEIDGNESSRLLSGETPEPVEKSANQEKEKVDHSDKNESVHSSSSGALEITETSEKLEYQYYEAKVESDKSLNNILFKSSKIKQDGKPYLGRANWRVNWCFRWKEDKQGICKIVEVSTQLRGMITLPKLTGSVTKEQIEQFNKFLENLKVHELGHYNNGKDAANSIRQRILSLPEMSSSGLIKTAANTAGHQVINEYREKDVLYDKETDHGRTQGACIGLF